MAGNRIKSILRDSARVAAAIEGERLKHEATLASALTEYWHAQDGDEVQEYAKVWLNHIGQRSPTPPPETEAQRKKPDTAHKPPPLNAFHDCWRGFARSFYNAIVEPVLSVPKLNRKIDDTLKMAEETVALVVFGASHETVGEHLGQRGKVERQIGGWRIVQPNGEAFISLDDARRLVGQEGAYDRLLKQTIYAVFPAEVAYAQYNGYLLYRFDVANSIDQTLAVERKRWVARPSNEERVKEFLQQAGQIAQNKITKKMLWTYAGYSGKTDLHHFEKDSPKCTDTARQNFERILALDPSLFVADLRQRNLL